MNRGVFEQTKISSSAPQFSKSHYFTQARAITLSLGMLLVACASRLLAAISSHHMRYDGEFAIAIFLISVGSIHGSLDIFKLRSLSFGKKTSKRILPVAMYFSIVLLGVASLIFSTLISVLLFVLISIVHFSIVEFQRRQTNLKPTYQVLRSVVTVVAVFSFTFRSTSSLASTILQRLVGHGTIVTDLLSWTNFLAFASVITIFAVGLVANRPLREYLEDLSLALALLIAPSLVVFAIFYGLRHGFDQWSIDRRGLDLGSVNVRILCIVLAATAALLLITVVLVGPLIALVALGFGLTLAHVSLDVRFRLRARANYLVG